MTHWDTNLFHTSSWLFSFDAGWSKFSRGNIRVSCDNTVFFPRNNESGGKKSSMCGISCCSHTAGQTAHDFPLGQTMEWLFSPPKKASLTVDLELESRYFHPLMCQWGWSCLYLTGFWTNCTNVSYMTRQWNYRQCISSIFHCFIHSPNFRLKLFWHVNMKTVEFSQSMEPRMPLPQKGHQNSLR